MRRGIVVAIALSVAPACGDSGAGSGPDASPAGLGFADPIELEVPLGGQVHIAAGGFDGVVGDDLALGVGPRLGVYLAEQGAFAERIDLTLGQIDVVELIPTGPLLVVQRGELSTDVVPYAVDGNALEPGPAIATSVGITAAVAADIDSDGALDIVAHREDVLTVLFADDSSADVAIPDPPGEPAIAAGDLDGDGLVDLLGGGRRGVIVVARQEADGVFGAGQELVSAPVADLFVRDLDGDGRSEAVLIAPDRIRALTFEGLTPVDVSVVDTAGEFRAGAALADLDADGAADLCVHTPEQTEVWLGATGEPGAFSRAVSLPVRAGIGCAAGDFDGDGRLDLAVATTAAAHVFLQD